MNPQATIRIINKGCIELAAFDAFGLSSKRNDVNTIGQYGTGNKYSVMFLLRNKIPFRIFSGNKEIVFSTKEENSLGMNYERIYINGERTSFTTAGGELDWKFWYCIREFWCNALDAGNAEMHVYNEINPCNDVIPYSEEHTTIYVDYSNNSDVLISWNKYFADERVNDIIAVESPSMMKANNHYSIMKRMDQYGILYYKNIRCISEDSKLRTIYDYNSNMFEITESRIIQSTYSIYKALGKILADLQDAECIQTIFSLLTHEDFLETHCIKHNYVAFNEAHRAYFLSNKFVVEEIAGRYIEEEGFNNLIKIPFAIAKLMVEFEPNVKIRGFVQTTSDSKGNELTIIPKENVPKRLLFLVQQTLKDLNDMGYSVNYPIIYFDEPPKKRVDTVVLKMGTVSNQKEIMLNIRLEDYGKKDIALTIMEEHEHILSAASDETRHFQNHIFRRMLHMMENHSGIFL